MATLKSKIHKMSDDTETLAKDYLKLFLVKQLEKIALFFGILISGFVLATLLLILVVFSSFAMARTLNNLLVGDFWGFVIVGGLYLLAIILLIVKIFRTHTPLFANLFIKLILAALDLDSDQPKSVKGLKKEQENIKHKIDTDKTKIEADFNLLRYAIMDYIFKEILGLFTFRKRAQEEPETEQEQKEGTVNS